ncbi:MAG: single-stranded DNA-binding protein [Bacteroidetes bacterium]|nr:MAG: single-stranded DNA-binding protein [Bacteroidota bacterium]
MNTLRNKVQLIGRVGAKPELQTVKGDYKLSFFSLATHEVYKDKEGVWQDQTNWHQIKAWGNVAERVVSTLDKGSEVVLEGRIVNRQFTAKDGEQRNVTEVELHEFVLLKRNQHEHKTEVKPIKKKAV